MRIFVMLSHGLMLIPVVLFRTGILIVQKANGMIVQGSILTLCVIWKINSYPITYKIQKDRGQERRNISHSFSIINSIFLIH